MSPAAPADPPVPVLDVVVPVHDEQADLEPSVRRLHAHLSSHFPYPFRITIADNASTDRTPQIAARLCSEIAEVDSLRMEQKGRGRALRAAWTASDARVLAYCDVDLSTDLAALLPLVAPLISGHSDLAIGTRLGRGSRVVRGAKREFISRSYNLILHGTLRTGFSDAQCGFKAISSDVARRLLPLVEDSGWFFDTELLVLAERAGLRIHEVPVDWVDDPNSTVDILATAIADLKGIARLSGVPAAGRLPVQLARFAAIGVASTLAYLLLYALLRSGLGPFGANLVALVVTAVGNTAANRRLTFGVRGRAAAATHHLQGLIVFGVGLALTSAALAALAWWAPHASRVLEMSVLLVANALATLLRFVAFRSWIFRPGRAVAPRPATDPSPQETSA